MIRLNPAIRAFAFTHKLNYTSIPYLSFLTNKFNMLFTELKTKATHLIRGESAEEQAHKFLIAKGLKPVCRNYRCKQGELDLIMTDQQTLVINLWGLVLCVLVDH